MPTRTSSGRSSNPSTPSAINEAIGEARQKIGGAPTVGFVFASPKHDLGLALKEARAAFPKAEILGCTTAGEITEQGMTHDGLALLLASLEDSIVGAAYAGGLREGWERAGESLCAGFGAVKSAGFSRGMSASTTVMLVDGLCGVGEKLVKAVRSHTSTIQQVVGGAAGDEGQFKGTRVGLNEACGEDSAVALHVFSKKMWAVGVNHGLTAASEQMKVTKAAGNVVQELDDKPAFEAYRAFAKQRGVELTPEQAGPFMINHELGIYFLDAISKARAPLSVDAQGGLACAADIPEGQFVSILDGNKPDLIRAAHDAAEEAKRNLGGHAAAGILLFDCICRGMILGDSFAEEIGAVKAVFPSVPVVGFLTYGEIARFKGKLDGWHNTTAVVAAIPA
jgi:hypothetical protein